MVSLVDAPEKGRRPADISYITTPSEKTSVRWSTSRPSACSGLMYWTVPMTTPGSVFRTVGISLSMGAARCAATFASPKSSTLAWLRAVIMMVRGLNVPVSDSFGVRFIQSVSDLRRNVDDFRCLQSAALEFGIKRLSLDVLHCDEVRAVGFADFVNVRTLGWLKADAALASWTKRRIRSGSAATWREESSTQR